MKINEFQESFFFFPNGNSGFGIKSYKMSYKCCIVVVQSALFSTFSVSGM